MSGSTAQETRNIFGSDDLFIYDLCVWDKPLFPIISIRVGGQCKKKSRTLTRVVRSSGTDGWLLNRGKGRMEM